MSNLYARAVFFVSDAERSLRYFTERLGFKEDWSFKEGARVVECGRPTLVVRDHDQNEIFFWVPGDNVTGYGVASLL